MQQRSHKLICSSCCREFSTENFDTNIAIFRKLDLLPFLRKRQSCSPTYSDRPDFIDCSFRSLDSNKADFSSINDMLSTHQPMRQRGFSRAIYSYYSTNLSDWLSEEDPSQIPNSLICAHPLSQKSFKHS